MAVLEDLAAARGMAGDAAPHPEEMRGSVDLRIGPRVSLRAEGRLTPAGLVSAGITVSAILLSVAVLVRALQGPRRW